MYKYKAHVPVEEYGYIEAEAETLEQIVNEYRDIKKATLKTGGMNIKAFSDFRKKVLTGEQIEPEEYESLSAIQKSWYNDTKNTLRALGAEE